MHIIATIGPRSSGEDVIDKIILGGATVIRINLSHGNYQDISDAIGYIRNKYENIKILMDLQGNKVRVSKQIITQFKAMEDSDIYFCSEEDYEECLKSLNKNFVIPLNVNRETVLNSNLRKIFMKDGTMEFIVVETTKLYIKTKVKIGGMVRAEKGCNLPGISRKGWGLTDKDKEDIEFAIKEKVDILCYSYCSYEDECREFKRLVFSKLKTKQMVPKLWGKIETKEGVQNIVNVAKELDGVVIARGDLVPETGLVNIPIIQDKIAHSLKGKNKEIVVATNVLNSMKFSSKPTVNELSDIYGMMKNGVTGFMLTGETTVGKNHREVVQLLKQTIEYYEGIINKVKKK